MAGPRITLGKAGGGMLTRRQSGPLVSSLIQRQNEVSHGLTEQTNSPASVRLPGRQASRRVN